jgi:Family of unknown function (DUF6262)
MTSELTQRVEQACHDLTAAGTPVTFTNVADQAGIARATLYRRPELRAVVEEQRQLTREALTLSGLAIQIDQLRTSLEAVAAKVRHHEEELRRLRRKNPDTRN